MLKIIKKSEEHFNSAWLLVVFNNFFCCRIIGYFPVPIQISEIRRHGSTLSSCTYKARVSVSFHKVQLSVFTNCNQKFSCWCNLGMAGALDICYEYTRHCSLFGKCIWSNNRCVQSIRNVSPNWSNGCLKLLFSELKMVVLSKPHAIKFLHFLQLRWVES